MSQLPENTPIVEDDQTKFNILSNDKFLFGVFAVSLLGLAYLAYE